MSTQTRVPTGVPTGGQFAASAKSEAAIDPWSNTPTADAPVDVTDPWAVPHNPFRPLLPGLSDAQDAEFRDLDEPVAALHPEDLSTDEKRRYLVLATGVDAATAKGADGWLPSCPVHADTLRGDLGAEAANRWGSDDACTACTENGAALPLTDRLTIPGRLGAREAAEARDRLAREAQTKRRNLAEGALSEVKQAFAVTEDEADHFDGDAHDALVAFDAAFDQAMFAYWNDRDTTALADTLDGIAVNEAAHFVDLARNQHPDDSAAIEWLRTAAARFRQV